jgi:hypothetical protein
MANLQPILIHGTQNGATKFISAGSILLSGMPVWDGTISGVILNGHQPLRNAARSACGIATARKIPRPAAVRRASE